MNARTTALSALIACRKQGAWADAALKEYIARDRLDMRDAALASRICYGVLQNRSLLDYDIQQCLTGSIQKLQPIVLDILRIGTYQIMMMDKIPVSAAVNEAVEQGKKYANRRAAGLINGVLRNMVRTKDTIPVPTDLSIRYSHPKELIDLFRDAVGEEGLEPLLASHNEAPRTVIQINPLTGEPEAVVRELSDAGVALEAHPWLPNAYYVSETGSLDKLQVFRHGGFLVQDPAARLTVAVAGLKPNMRVLDCCAAPGGKSFAAAMEMENRGEIISCDIHDHKIKLLNAGAERLHISILTAMVHDARAFHQPWEDGMDVVFADVPCSGMGVIRKKPDIRYKSLDPLSKLPAIQKDILNTACNYVKPGGVLMYSTCTILKRENEQVISHFLANHPNFQIEPFALPEILGGSCPGQITLLPSIHQTDGFFICKLRRNL